jgi:AcrR family transcriptional regulator
MVSRAATFVNAPTPTTRSAGRPRNQALDTAILAAAKRQLAELGYAGMSLESVAAAAGTTVPSVRRRYTNKVQLVAAVIDSLRVAPLPPGTGSPRADAQAILRDFNRVVLRDNALTVVGSLLAEEHRHPELLQRFRTGLVESRRAQLRQALAAGVSAGQLPLATDLDVVTSMLIGSFYGRYLTTAGLPANWADQVLDALWPPATPTEGSSVRSGYRPDG